MLLEEFDNNKIAMINPEDVHKTIPNMPKTCVAFFSKSLMDLISENYNTELITEEIHNSTMIFPVYKVNINGTDLALMQFPVGAPACVACLEELIPLGVKNIIAVGCCGCLTNDIEEYSIIIPTSAIRDEGTSYHYEKATDETILCREVSSILEDVMKAHNIKYMTGKTWTTDAIFRETKAKLKDRISRGAITVDMECSAMNVACQFRDVNFGQLFYGLDNLANEEYDPRSFIISNTSHNSDTKSKIIALALECGFAIDKKFN